METRKGKFTGMSVRNQGTTKKGQPYYIYEVGLQFNSGKEFKPTLPSWAKEVVDQVKKFPVGSMIEIGLDDRNNVASATVLSGPEEGSPAPGPQTSRPSAGGGQGKGAGGQFRDPDEIIRGEALITAVTHYGHLMENSERLAKLVKKTETLDNLEAGLFEFAAKAEKFVKGVFKPADPKASNEDLSEYPADLDQPDVPDDI